MRIVCDSSTIIALERINYLWLLEKIAQEVFIPPTVSKEIQSKKSSNLPACFKVKEPGNNFFIKQNRGTLHVGEVEAICLAKDVKADLIILDDKKARKLAEKEGLKVAGLLALLIMAKEKGFIKRVKPLIDDLKRNSFYNGKWIPIKEPLPLNGMQYVGFGRPLSKEQLNKLAQPLFKKAIHQ